MEHNNLLVMRNINKTFPGVRALNDVDFTLREGEIHSLMGENGAGKSTLIKVLTAVHGFDSGVINLYGQEVSFDDPLAAQEAQISTVYQEVNLCNNLSVAENIFIGREPRKLGLIDWKAIHHQAKTLLAQFQIDIDVTKPLAEYSVAIQQMVAIARAVDTDARILILDEPTSSLDENETQHLFSVMRRLRDQGMGIVFVSHFLDQIYEICDRVTILRNGHLVGVYDIEDLPRAELVSKMIGKDFGDIQAINKPQFSGQDVHIEVDGVFDPNRVINLEMNLKKGEIVGFAGLLGSGRTEIADILFGIRKPIRGKLKVHDQLRQYNQPIDAMMDLIALCPEDRKRYGIIEDLSVRENIIIALQAKQGVFKHMSREKQIELADYYIDLLEIKTSSREQIIKTLSGGNQQKVIIARWLATDPELLILDEPTRGIDIGTKTAVQKLAIDLAQNQGVTIVFISSEIDEMTRTCNRILVLRDKKLVGELTDADVNSDKIMQAIAGGETHETH